MANTELHERLRRLGVGRGPGQVKARPKGRAIEDLLPGEVVDTDHGPFFLLRDQYSLDYQHGHHRLDALLSHQPQSPALLARDERLADVDLRRVAFIDTETTGLAGGTGTYAFLVGVGVFEEEAFTVHQFFMRDYVEEPAQLLALGELLDGMEAVVSFNGKSFDMPLLETRFVMTRQPPRLVDAPHLDLLVPARRFWKHRLASCALSNLEVEILGLQRTQEDVPGWLIPDLFQDYARSGDAREMPRIFYHNAQDILSLVTLATQMCDLLTTPLPAAEHLFGEDLYGLGRLLHDLGQIDQAELAYVQAAERSLSPYVREVAMRDLAFLLKRQERRQEALPWWQRLAETAGAVYACEELAKHHEWQDEDLAQAMVWTERGISLVEAWSRGPKRQETLKQLAHRQERLERKMSQTEPGPDVG
jgi:uncharacterized protein YprB with RNaseH-like and TPR domain